MKQKLPSPSGEIVAAYTVRHHKTQTPLGTMGKSLLNVATSRGPATALSPSGARGSGATLRGGGGPPSSLWALPEGKTRLRATGKLPKQNQLNYKKEVK